MEDTAKIRTVPLDFLRFYDLEVETDEDVQRALEQVLPATGGEDFYRITLTGSAVPDLVALLEHFSQFPNLELRDRTEPPVPLWTQLEEDSLRGVYFRLLKDSQDPNAPLAAEISQKLLSGKEVQLP